MKVALVYDRVNKWGGAERVLLALHELFPDAPLYTSVYSPKNAPWASVFPRVITSFIDKIPFVRTRHQLIPWLMPLAFESFNFDEYDLVISVSSEASKGIVTRPHTTHICYCLTPTRYLWSGYRQYFGNRLFKILALPAVKYLKTWDKVAACRPDLLLANSHEVSQRIRKFYGRESTVVHSPVDDIFIKCELDSSRKTGDYYLVVSRLEKYKKVDLVIKAFNRLKIPLYVIGTGSQYKKLKRMANPHIKFLGQLTDEELVEYYKKCTALIFPQEEDFGLVPIEAQACGTAVIAYGKGGALETVIENKTGIFFTKDDVDSLIDAVNRFKVLKISTAELKANAEKFTRDKFLRTIQQIVDTIYMSK